VKMMSSLESGKAPPMDSHGASGPGCYGSVKSAAARLPRDPVMSRTVIHSADHAKAALLRFAWSLALAALVLMNDSCSISPEPASDGIRLPDRSRVGLITFGSGPSRLEAPQTPGEAARSGWKRATDLPYGNDPGENVVYGIVGLALTPVLAGSGAMQGVSEKDRLTSAAIVRRVHSSVDWRKLFEDQWLRHATATTTHDTEVASRPSFGTFNPAWRDRYDAVLAIDWKDPSLQGNGGPNPRLWTELSLYWSLVDPDSGKSMAGGPLVVRSSARRSFIGWTQNDGTLLADAFTQTVRQAATAVVEASLIRGQTTDRP
jgi:hypothetical protein